MNNEKVIKTEVADDFTIREIFENGCYKEVRYVDKEHTKIDCIQYFNSKGEFHRDNDLPGYISYWYSDNIYCEAWHQSHNLHRLTESALIYYEEDGKVELEEYYINGKELSKEQWQKEVNLYNNLKVFLNE